MNFYRVQSDLISPNASQANEEAKESFLLESIESLSWLVSANMTGGKKFQMLSIKVHTVPPSSA